MPQVNRKKYGPAYSKKHISWAEYQKKRKRSRLDGKVKCGLCKRWKSSHLFYKQTRMSAGTTPYQAHCKNCDRVRQRSEYTTERRWAKRLKVEYKMTAEEYSELYFSQDGKCAICEIGQEYLDVDHDHKTGKVRGLLCGLCNKAIGLLRDDPTNLRRAITYLLGR